MEQGNESPVRDRSTILLEQIENISDQLCLAVKGNFDFTVITHTTEESVQKLSMLLNFVTDTARRALSEVKEQNNKLTELDRLKTDFIANVSHELRTPLTLIMGPLESILTSDSSSFPQKHLENLKRMERNAVRLYFLVNNLLDFSKLEADKFIIHEELVDVGEFISRIIDDAQGLAIDLKLTLKYRQRNKFDPMFLDIRMLEKIVLNLVGNALKFTPQGGRIEVDLEKKKVPFS